MARPKKNKTDGKKKLKTKAAPKSTPTNRKKIQTKPDIPTKAKRKGPGRPPSKKPILGYDISNKDQNRIGTEFSAIQVQFDKIANNVASFAFEASPKAAIMAIKDIVALSKEMNGLRRTLRVVKKNLKPKLGELNA